MLIIAAFLAGLSVGIGFCTLVLIHSRYEAQLRELESNFDKEQAEITEKYANLRAQIKVGGTGNIQENETRDGFNSQVQVGGTGNSQSIK